MDLTDLPLEVRYAVSRTSRKGMAPGGASMHVLRFAGALAYSFGKPVERDTVLAFMARYFTPPAGPVSLGNVTLVPNFRGSK